MKKTTFNVRLLLLSVFVSGFWNSIVGQDAEYTFNHGPYLQGLTTNEVNVYFTTSEKGFSKVEVKKASDDSIREFVTVNDGLVEAYNTMNAIKIDALQPNTAYEYRLVSKEIKDFQPYKVTFGAEIVSKWYSFRTLDPAADNVSFIVTSDLHDDPAKYRKLMGYLPVEEAQMVFLLGDIMSYFHKPTQPYTSFIDPSVDMFAKEKPFVIVRGNHETRGNLARTYHKYIYKPNGHFYGLYRIGETVILMLDSGEDKPDTHSVYAGITAFDKYRDEQVVWLKKIVASDEFLEAKHRIVMVHIPPVVEDASKVNTVEYTASVVERLFMPTLNNAGVDLMICGHTHKQMFVEVQKGINNFPIVINDNNSASFLAISPKGINVKTINADGLITLNAMIDSSDTMMSTHK